MASIKSNNQNFLLLCTSSPERTLERVQVVNKVTFRTVHGFQEDLGHKPLLQSRVSTGKRKLSTKTSFSKFYPEVNRNLTTLDLIDLFLNCSTLGSASFVAIVNKKENSFDLMMSDELIACI